MGLQRGAVSIKEHYWSIEGTATEPGDSVDRSEQQEAACKRALCVIASRGEGWGRGLVFLGCHSVSHPKEHPL